MILRAQCHVFERFFFSSATPILPLIPDTRLNPTLTLLRP
jgi:hypothetical protein